jgi:putative transposase
LPGLQEEAEAQKEQNQQENAKRCVGPNPTDRGKLGVKDSLLVEGAGGALALVIAGANVNDHLLLAATLDAIVVQRPQPTEQAPQHLSLDKGFDNDPTREVVQARGYVPHIRRIGEEKKDQTGQKKHPARRWVVERTFSWLSRWRGILIRWEKKPENYLASLKLACALLWFRRAYKLGSPILR